MSDNFFKWTTTVLLFLVLLSQILSVKLNEKPYDPIQAQPNHAMKDSGGVSPAIQSVPDLPKTIIRFDEESHDFRVIPDSHKVYHKFRFTNMGKEPLMILSAEGSCGCTVPSWPKTAIKPGDAGEIEVSFDPNGKSGENSKIVTVTSNTEPQTSILTIKATVVKSN